MAGAAHVAVATRFDVLVGADLVRRGVRAGEVLTLEGLAELVVEPFGLEIALFLGHPLVQTEVRRYQEFGLFLAAPSAEKVGKDKREIGNP